MLTATLPPCLTVTGHFSAYRLNQRFGNGLPAHPRLTYDADTRSWHARNGAWAHQWLPTGHLTAADADAAHDVIDVLAHGLRAHAWIITPRALGELITHSRELLSEYLTECGLTPLDPDRYEVACAHEYGGPDPDALRAILTRYAARDPRGAHPAFAPLLRRAQHLAQRARRSTPPGTSDPLLSYCGWVDPLLLVNPTRDSSTFDQLYQAVNDCYTNHLEGGDDEDTLATFTRGDTRALHAWSRAADRLSTEATALVDELRALTDTLAPC